MAHRVAEYPGEMLGQENGLDQNDHRQRPHGEAGKKSARIVAAQEVRQGHSEPCWCRRFEVRLVSDISHVANFETKTTPGFNKLLVSLRFRNSPGARYKGSCEFRNRDTSAG